MLKRIAMIAAVAAAPMLFPSAAQAQNAPVNGVRTVYGEDPCPPTDICVRAPESDRYRIPNELRQPEVRRQATESWAVRSEDALTVGRTGTGSCSTVGAGGQTGCFVKQATQARADARARKEAETNLPLP